jgi:hypothetical protein
MEPKGNWQSPSPTLRICDRHSGRCAYRQGDPERCDYCHASWVAVETIWQDRRTKDRHITGHEWVDARRVVGAVRRSAGRTPNSL